jgi:hypothetical protein
MLLPGPRLQVRVVAEVGVAEDSGVPGMRTAATEADPQLVYPLEVPGRRAFRPVDLEAEPALGADDDPGGLQRPDGSGRPRIRCEARWGGGVVVVFHRAHLPVLDDGEVGAGAHRQDRALGVDGARQRVHRAYRPEHVLHQVDDVTQ